MNGNAPELHVRIGRLVIDATAIEDGALPVGAVETSLRAALERRLAGPVAGAPRREAGQSGRADTIADAMAGPIASAVGPVTGR